MTIEEVLKLVARRVVDEAMLHLIRIWLEAPVEEIDEGRKKRNARIESERFDVALDDDLDAFVQSLLGKTWLVVAVALGRVGYRCGGCAKRHLLRLFSYLIYSKWRSAVIPGLKRPQFARFCS